MKRFDMLMLAAWVVGVSTAAATKAGPLLHLDHVIVYVDDADWQALAAAESLAELGDVQARTTSANIGTWTGLYLTGENTYVEVFSRAHPPSTSSDQDCGIAFSVEREGDLARLSAELAASAPEIAFARQALSRADGSPWFQLLEPQVVGLRAGMGAIEYAATFLDSVDPAHPRAPGSTELLRRRSTQRRYAPRKALRDLVGVQVALGPTEAKILGALLVAGGYTKQETATGTVYSGAGARIEVVGATAARRGVQNLDLVLAAAGEASRVRIGDKIDLTRNASAAHLTFR